MKVVWFEYAQRHPSLIKKHKLLKSCSLDQYFHDYSCTVHRLFIALTFSSYTKAYSLCRSNLHSRFLFFPLNFIFSCLRRHSDLASCFEALFTKCNELSKILPERIIVVGFENNGRPIFRDASQGPGGRQKDWRWNAVVFSFSASLPCQLRRCWPSWSAGCSVFSSANSCLHAKLYRVSSMCLEPLHQWTAGWSYLRCPSLRGIRERHLQNATNLVYKTAICLVYGEISRWAWVRRKCSRLGEKVPTNTFNEANVLYTRTYHHLATT